MTIVVCMLCEWNVGQVSKQLYVQFSCAAKSVHESAYFGSRHARTPFCPWKEKTEPCLPLRLRTGIKSTVDRYLRREAGSNLFAGYQP